MILLPGHIRNNIKPEIRFICGFISPHNAWSQDDFINKLVKLQGDELLAALKRHCLYPSFCKSLQGFELPHTIEWDSFGTELKKTMQHNAAQMLKKTSILIKIQTEFRNNGVPVIFLKGPALSQRLFGDVAMRYSWDLDILVQTHNLGKAVELLVNSGYSGDLISSITKKQLAYCLKNFQHFTFYNTEENSCIELHWHITSLDLLTSNNTDTLFLNTEQLIIAGKPVIVLKPEFELAYLISHAAFHAFHRLQWLYDIKLYFEQPAINKNTDRRICSKLGIYRII